MQENKHLNNWEASLKRDRPAVKTIKNKSASAVTKMDSELIIGNNLPRLRFIYGSMSRR